MTENDFRFSFPIRVRYSEVDPQAVVFNSRYLEYADLAVVEYWRAIGIRPIDPDSIDCHVAKATVTYRKPIHLDELIQARVRIDRFGTTSMTWTVNLTGDAVDDLRAHIELVYVHVDLATGQTRPLPQTFRDRVAAFQSGSA